MDFKGEGSMTNRDLIVVLEPKHQSKNGNSLWLKVYSNLEADAEAAKTTTMPQLSVRDSTRNGEPVIDPKTNQPYKDYSSKYGKGQAEKIIEAVGGVTEYDEDGHISGVQIPEGNDTIVYDEKRKAYNMSVTASVMPEKDGPRNCYVINTNKEMKAGATLTEDSLSNVFKIQKGNQAAKAAAKAAKDAEATIPAPEAEAETKAPEAEPDI